MSIEEDILTAKAELDAKQNSYNYAVYEKNRAKQEALSLLERVKEEFGVSSLAQAQELLDSMRQQLTVMLNEISVKLGD